MTVATEALARHGVHVTDAELAAELDRALEGTPGAAEATSLSDAEVSFLAEHGGQGVSQMLAALDPAQAYREQTLAKARTAARMLRGLLTRDAAADLLGIDASGVSRRIRDGRLWALPRSGRRIPAWQIRDGRLLPGLPEIVAALPDDADPLGVEGFMSTPQDDLGGITPIRFVTAGGDPKKVAEMVADLDRW